MAAPVLQFPRRTLSMMRDSLINFVSGLGTVKDPTAGASYIVNELSRLSLENAYRGDWVARKIVDVPAQDATREWRLWQAAKPEIEKLEEVEKNLRIQQKTKMALIKARLYGGSCMVMGVDDGLDPSEPLEPDRVTQDTLKFVHVLSRYEINTGNLIEDLESEWYGEPSYYERTSTANGQRARLHPSRVVRFIGAELPDPRGGTAGANAGWGDSILQAIDGAVRATGLVQQSIAVMVNDAKMDVIKIPEFSKHMATDGYAAELLTRFTLANQAKSTVNSLVLDKEEEWERITTSFAGLPEIMQMYLLIASGAADIPATRLLGQSPKGLNATGENDIRNYYDHVASEQETTLSPGMARLDDTLVRSTLGKDDPSIHYEWAPLWQMDETQKAELANKKATTFKLDVDMAVINEDVLRTVRVNQLIEDATYPGIEDAIDEFGDEPVEPPGAFDPVTGLPTDPVVAAAAKLGAGQPPPPAAKKPPPGGNTNPALKGKTGRVLPFKKKAVGDEGHADIVARTRQAVRDAEPRSLYVRRDVLNAEDIIKWAKRQGFETTVPAEEMHVTIAYSKAPVDWMKLGSDWGSGSDADGNLRIKPGGVRIVERLGKAVALLFTSSDLSWRHVQIKEGGATWDYADYQPHLTITWQAAENMNLDDVEPYRGPIELGPEIFEEVSDGWSSTFEEDANPNHEPAGSDRGGEFASASGGGGGGKRKKAPQFFAHKRSGPEKDLSPRAGPVTDVTLSEYSDKIASGEWTVHHGTLDYTVVTTKAGHELKLKVAL
jgi:phage-related protein (TIGR01555 family)